MSPAASQSFTLTVDAINAVSVTSNGIGHSYCALLNSGGVDCWGSGQNGELGNGSYANSTTPTPVSGVGGSGMLSGVVSLIGGDVEAYCALLTSGEVDCWGNGFNGDLGDGQPHPLGSATPVQVEGAGGTGILSGVSSLASDGTGYCAALTSGGADCWGYGYDGELGNGTFYTAGDDGSATPVQVQGVGGVGTLTDVAALTGGGADGLYGFYCAVLTSGGVDCWGYGYDGELGDGVFHTTGGHFGSATPVQVQGVGGVGTLTGVASLVSDNRGFCALLASTSVDCWGLGSGGQLGDNNFADSATPVQVVETSGSGALSGVVSVALSGSGYSARCSMAAMLFAGGLHSAAASTPSQRFQFRSSTLLGSEH